jgi:hypothetical protein
VTSEASLPQVSLSRRQNLRLTIVGILVALAVARVVPDFVRIAYPLHFFGYTTNGDAIVVRPVLAPPPAAGAGASKPARERKGHAAAKPTPAPTHVDRLIAGDRVRVDRIKPVDRKPGIAGRGYSYDNPDRHLPIERAGRERVVHLVGRTELPQLRFLDMLRVVIFLVAVSLGAILFLVKPSYATAGFFVFCLGAVEGPSTYLSTLMPYPWRELPDLVGAFIAGCVRPALMLFAFCLIDGDADAPRERLFAWFAAIVGIAIGTANAYASWMLNYDARPAESIIRAVSGANYAVSTMTAIAFGVAFLRARRNDRHRIGWIVVAFVFAGMARLISEEFNTRLWINSILVSASIVPIVVVWIAVIRHQFFNVDFVVSRAVVYVALTAAVIGTISVTEEIGTYVFYNNTDLTYGVLIAISMGVGSLTGKIKEVLDRIVDRFIFRDRQQQREALDLIAGYVLDAETFEDVYRALLQDAAHALKLSFGGILARQPDGSYTLAHNYEWPPDCVIQLGPSDELTRAITRTRGALTFSGKDTRMIQQSFPNERVTFAAPLFYGRLVSGIVVYGHNVSGLDLDPEEREHLVRVVAHASIALNAIELAKLYALASSAGIVSPALEAEISAPLPGTG